jgi:superfamily II DNA or RNA helicase
MTNVEPRSWQTDFVRAALAHFAEPHSRNFLAAVCPGAGKTIGAYLLIQVLLNRGDVRHAIIVGHTDRIRSQWIETARSSAWPWPRSRRQPPVAHGARAG